MRQVILQAEKGGFWRAECPSLPGCTARGKTREEAVLHIKQVIEDCLAELKKKKIPLAEEEIEIMVEEQA